MDWRLKPVAGAETVSHNLPKRTLGSVQLILLGLASIVGTGIFILTAEAAQRAGPAMIVSFAIAALVCAATALCYAEFASVAPMAGGGYSYAYISVGEIAAWIVGWGLLAEYVLGTSAIAVGWSGYLVGLLERLHLQVSELAGLSLPRALTSGLFAGGVINVPAAVIVLCVTSLLIVGTRTGVGFAICLLIAKLATLILFVGLVLPSASAENFVPFAPKGVGGIGAAAASIFFAYLGYDNVASAGEETRNAKRALPIAILGSFAIATLLYIVVAIAAVAAIGAQPVTGADGTALAPGSAALLARCEALEEFGSTPLACSREALAYVLQLTGHPGAAAAIGLVVFLTLPSALVSTLFALSRLLFALARDGLLPVKFAKTDARFGTPARMIVMAGVVSASVAALFPVGQLADVANAGTLLAFFIIAVGILAFRCRQPSLSRPFRVTGAWVIAPLAAAGCAYLFSQLSAHTLAAFAIWIAGGVALYFVYGRHRSLVGARTDD